MKNTLTHTQRGLILVSRIRWVQGQSAPVVAALSVVWCGLCMKPSEGKTALHTNHYCSSVAAIQPLIYSTAWFGWVVDTQADTHTHTPRNIPHYTSGLPGRQWETLLCGEGCVVVNTSSWIHTIHHDFKVCSRLSFHSRYQCAAFIYVEAVKWASTWQKSVASAIHMPQSNTSPVNYLWLLYHVSYTVCSILNT